MANSNLALGMEVVRMEDCRRKVEAVGSLVGPGMVVLDLEGRPLVAAGKGVRHMAELGLEKLRVASKSVSKAS